MTGFIRRVVTGHDENGKAIVVSDGMTPNVKTNPLRPGHRSTDVWKSTTAPVMLSKDEPDPTAGPRAIHPPPQGTIIRIAEMQPETDDIRNLTPEKAREIFRAAGNENASTFGRGGRHPLMHRTETLDYAVILEGELTMLLDEGEVTLKTGDVLIQRGTNHAWVNRSNKVCRILFVLIDGKFDSQLEARFKSGSGH